MGKLIDVNKWFKDTFPKADLDYSNLDNKKAYPHWSTDITGLVNILNDAESVEAITKDHIAKAIDKVEEYICDVETNTVKAQGMAQALDIFEKALSEVEDENKAD